ncbi:hypothetical protein K2173_004675 [Erythroxylum novogranatense]|uniref:Uncharacterized protein n=1 Tax=Erythroxylum novogranatense TaxID=1862640 RepID=A0AAV8T4X6_9ROSI|nr:hypothetical protein K2173_004675 [Erythroxylum novogranatense]
MFWVIVRSLAHRIRGIDLIWNFKKVRHSHHKKVAYEENGKNENEDNTGTAGVDDENHDHFHDIIEQGAEHNGDSINGDKMGENKEKVNEETERDGAKRMLTKIVILKGV